MSDIFNPNRHLPHPPTSERCSDFQKSSVIVDHPLNFCHFQLDNGWSITRLRRLCPAAEKKKCKTRFRATCALSVCSYISVGTVIFLTVELSTNKVIIHLRHLVTIVMGNRRIIHFCKNVVAVWRGLEWGRKMFLICVTASFMDACISTSNHQTLLVIECTYKSIKLAVNTNLKLCPLCMCPVLPKSDSWVLGIEQCEQGRKKLL